MPRYVYRFGAGDADGHGGQEGLLGSKGANLAEMTNLGIPVPPGFTITTEVCSYYHDNGESLPDEIIGQVDGSLEWLDELVGAGFGDPADPLLLSVRPGAPVPMPGAMSAVLNLGLSGETVKGLAQKTGDARFAYDCYRRFVARYGEVVMGVTAPSESETDPFARILAEMKAERGVQRDSELTTEDLEKLVTEYKVAILRATNDSFPEDPMLQLWGAIDAVIRSWHSPRASAYRRLHEISEHLGTAVNVQLMAFGNMGLDCATGVAFTRDPASGEPGMHGEFLVDAQGEDLPSGDHTRRPIADLAAHDPRSYKEIASVCARLERHFGDLQEVAFTIQQGKLWMLQTRTGKRTGKAMVRIAVDLVSDGAIDAREAILRIEPNRLDELLRPTIVADSRPPALARGLPASPGAAVGRVVFTSADAQAWAERGEQVVLVHTDPTADDLSGLKAARAILTMRGGMTSHAAVIARSLGKCCITACKTVRVHPARERASVGETTIAKGDVVTLDGTTGEVFLGALPLEPAQQSPEFARLMGWVDEFRRLRVRTNVDSATEALTARAFGAEGVGLCRTEHMFLAPERILAVRQMILAADQRERQAALDKILPIQRADFIALFEAMNGLPVTIRLLDPPPHEFLPQSPEDIAEVARQLGQPPDAFAAVVRAHRATNPMLGHRGCRLAISYPEIYQVQARAIAEAIVEVVRAGGDVQPEIMVPFVAMAEELGILRALVEETVDDVFREADVNVDYLIGTMIELPRACLVGDQIAEHADFFSFGTNDLTQTTYGLSRDDAGAFLPDYLDRGVLTSNPFVGLDVRGVGSLIRIGVEKGRAVKTKLKIGICGEHAGEPGSVEFCHREGFDYVSCSPFRVPIARVAAAQAALRREARSR